VALSFLRAHTTWIGQRYQLYTNPRRRRHRDWMLGFLSVADEISGTSIGAALAGTAPLLTALRGKGLRGRSLYLCVAVTLASYFFSGGVPENVYITGTASISGTPQLHTTHELPSRLPAWTLLLTLSDSLCVCVRRDGGCAVVSG
jgi:hypothetical protein